MIYIIISFTILSLLNASFYLKIAFFIFYHNIRNIIIIHCYILIIIYIITYIIYYHYLKYHFIFLYFIFSQIHSYLHNSFLILLLYYSQNITIQFKILLQLLNIV